MKILPFEVETEIGEKGINLSGGQKARVAFARALYSDRDIYLLDDILSAVDVHVGEYLMRETLNGYLKGKTIIMPTHAVKFAEMVDEIIIMEKGRIVRKGHFRDISGTA
jgi:ABC-type multidrug transport system fused ATPase/permease subunit